MPEKLSVEEQAKLREMFEYWDNVKLSIRFLIWLGKTLKWFIGLGAALATVWAILHGNSPK